MFAKLSENRMLRINGSIVVVVGREIHHVFLLWKDVKSSPVYEVHQIGQIRQRCVSLDNGTVSWDKIRWDAQITELEEDRKIAWESISGDVANCGEVLFTPEEEGKKTRIELTMVFETGLMGESLLRLLKDPQKQLQENLENSKKRLNPEKVYFRPYLCSSDACFTGP